MDQRLKYVIPINREEYRGFVSRIKTERQSSRRWPDKATEDPGFQRLVAIGKMDVVNR